MQNLDSLSGKILRVDPITGKGLSDLIREEFGFRVTFFLMAVVLVVNLGNVMAEFTGVFWATETLDQSAPARRLSRLRASVYDVVGAFRSRRG